MWPAISYYDFPMMLEKFEHNFYAALARNEILSRRGSSFQDFFVAVGHHCWAPDFEGRRAQGRIGDKKCDGYRPSGAIVFQCYAPREMKPGLLCRKIDEDFRGALTNREHTPIGRWILVHNDFEELPTQAHELIIKLRSERDSVPIEILGPEPLIMLIMGLGREKLMLLFPNGLATDDLRKIHYRDIDELIQTIGELTFDWPSGAVEAPSSRKIEHNGFSEPVSGILKGGFLVQRRFANYFADTSRAEVGNRLAEKFKRLYAEKKAQGIDADQIFFALTDAVGGLACEKPRRAAIVGLVTYMFHSCEIYEDAPIRAEL
ncbi:MAG: ABC-three component system protein [Candidatus Acidiferrales bacterium]